MAGMDFDAFAQGFRERTSQRMVEFEKTLAKAQADLEKAAREAREKQLRAAAAPGAGHAPGAGQVPLVTPSAPQPVGYRRRSEAPNSGSNTGQVRSVLRRG